MRDKQYEAVKALVEKLGKEKRTKEQALKTFVNAGILTKKGNFTKPYAILDKLFITTKD